MRNLILLIVFLFASLTFVNAQRYAYVDSEYILSNIPEYGEAQTTIDELAIKWQEEIEQKFTEIDALYKSFQNDAPLLTQDMRNRREHEIIQKEKAAKDLQKKRFGNDGDLFKKRQELIRPIQDKIYNSIEKRAKARQYVFVFDRSDNSSIMYADPKIDISNFIIKDMGYAPDAKKKTTIEIGGSKTDIEKNIKIGN